MKIKQVSGLQTELDGKITTVAAQSYADGVANTAETNANTYTDTQVSTISNTLSSALQYKGTFNIATDTATTIANGSQGDYYKIIGGTGTLLGVSYTTGDSMIFNKNVTGNPVAADLDKLDNTELAELASTTAITPGGTYITATNVESAMLEVDSAVASNATAVATAQSTADTAGTNIGTMGSLTTTATADLVSAVNEVKAASTAAQAAANAAQATADANELQFTEVTEETVNITAASGVAFTATTANVPKAGFNVIALINGLELVDSEYGVVGSTATITVPYAIDPTDKITLKYSY